MLVKINDTIYNLAMFERVKGYATDDGGSVLHLVHPHPNDRSMDVKINFKGAEDAKKAIFQLGKQMPSVMVAEE